MWEYKGIDSSNSFSHGRTKGSVNGVSHTKGYKAIGNLAKGIWDATLGRYIYKNNVKARAKNVISNVRDSLNPNGPPVPTLSDPNNPIIVENIIKEDVVKEIVFKEASVNEITTNEITIKESTIKEVMTNEINSGKDFVSNYTKSSVSAIKSSGSKLVTAGKTLVNSFISAVSKVATNAYNNAKTGVANAYNDAKDYAIDTYSNVRNDILTRKYERDMEKARKQINMAQNMSYDQWRMANKLKDSNDARSTYRMYRRGEVE